MTDIENLRLDWRDEDGSAQFASPLRTAAAVYIAELEADLDVMTKRWLHSNEQAERWSLRHQQADKLLHEAEAELRVALDHERELAALKGRRCETCVVNNDCEIQHAAQAGDLFYCAAWLLMNVESRAKEGGGDE